MIIYDDNKTDWINILCRITRMACFLYKTLIIDIWGLPVKICEMNNKELKYFL